MTQANLAALPARDLLLLSDTATREIRVSSAARHIELMMDRHALAPIQGRTAMYFLPAVIPSESVWRHRVLQKLFQTHLLDLAQIVLQGILEDVVEAEAEVEAGMMKCVTEGNMTTEIGGTIEPLPLFVVIEAESEIGWIGTGGIETAQAFEAAGRRRLEVGT